MFVAFSMSLQYLRRFQTLYSNAHNRRYHEANQAKPTRPVPIR
jgi:hypothetical protein